MSECSHDCGSCSSAGSCGENKKSSFIEAPHPMSHIKNVIGIASGKGGVGKSMVTTMTAIKLARKGYKVGILDADITGPSIPKAFGLDTQRAEGAETGFLPVETRLGIKIMSVNLIVNDPEQPVIWRGPILGGVVKQFWTDVIWGDIDFLLVDMPPGTGDIPLTIFQSVPLDGLIIVTSPQDLVSMIVEKAVRMAEQMNIKILGLVENMSYLVCPDCNKKIYIYGESRIDEIAEKDGLEVLAKCPVMPALASSIDSGNAEFAENVELGSVIEKLEKIKN